MGPHNSGRKGRQTGRRMSKFMLERSNARHHRSTDTGTMWNNPTKSQTNPAVPVERGPGTEGGFSPPFRRSVPVLSLVWNAERRQMPLHENWNSIVGPDTPPDPWP